MFAGSPEPSNPKLRARGDGAVSLEWPGSTSPAGAVTPCLPWVALLSGRGRLAFGWQVADLFLSTVLSQSPRGKILLGLTRALNRVLKDEQGYTKQLSDTGTFQGLHLQG